MSREGLVSARVSNGGYKEAFLLGPKNSDLILLHQYLPLPLPNSWIVNLNLPIRGKVI